MFVGRNLSVANNTNRSVQFNSVYFIFYIYTTLFLITIFFFDSESIGRGLLFLLANFILSSFFSVNYWRNVPQPLGYLLYGVFFFSYIVKAIFQDIIGLNTFYNSYTILTYISKEAYFSSLTVVTIAHLILVVFLIVLPLRFSARPFVPVGSKITQSTGFFLLFVVAGGTLITAGVMYSFGVAVMGTVGVQLPFQLSGIFYYGRTILAPLILLHLVQFSILRKDKLLEMGSIFVFLILVLTEVLIRASKSPMLSLALYLMLMYYYCTEREKEGFSFRTMKVPMLFLLIGLITWPIIEMYRNQVTGFSQESVGLLNSFDTVGDYVLYIGERFLQRLVGFLQLMGIVSDWTSGYVWQDIASMDSIARYYTEVYLGYRIDAIFPVPQ